MSTTSMSSSPATQTIGAGPFIVNLQSIREDARKYGAGLQASRLYRAIRIFTTKPDHLDTPDTIFIAKPDHLDTPDTLEDCIRINTLIIGKIRSLGCECSEGILTASHIHKFSRVIKNNQEIDVALKKIWGAIYQVIILRDPTFVINPAIRAPDIRAWMHQNPTLLQTIDALDLSEKNLRTLPEEIGLLPGLKCLDLSKNQLTTFPPIITKRLRGLNILKLNRNQLQMLPPKITKLRALTELDLSDNQLQRLPTEVAQLPALKVLHLKNNPLQEVPLLKSAGS